jgi:streptomycin 6-kinase
MHRAPFEAAAIARYPTKQAWDSASTEIVLTMLERWHLTPIRSIGDGYAASTMIVRQSDGAPAVLKVGFPHWEAEWEAIALDAMGPELAPRVLRSDEWTWAMLLDHVTPGVTLGALSTSHALEIAAELLLRMRAVAVPEGMPTAAATIARFVSNARERHPVLPDRVLEALDELESLVASTSDALLVHGDFNPGNALSNSDSGWLVIDPKPMVGDQAYDPFPMLAQLGEAPRGDNAARDWSRRIERVSSAASLNADRVARWAFGRAGLAWCWFRDDGLARDAHRESEELEALAEVLGR